MTNPSNLARLQRWYQSQCDGDWEHSYGIKIDTLDNPGWTVTVDLKDTPWERLVVLRRVSERSEKDWVQIEVDGGRFTGCGGSGNLDEILELFLDLVKTPPE
jgi:Immunity protein 53